MQYIPMMMYHISTDVHDDDVDFASKDQGVFDETS